MSRQHGNSDAADTASTRRCTASVSTQRLRAVHECADFTCGDHWTPLARVVAVSVIVGVLRKVCNGTAERHEVAHALTIAEALGAWLAGEYEAES